MDLTRRNVLTGVGAAALAGGIAGVVAPQNAVAESGDSGFDGSLGPGTQQAPVSRALTPGLSYLAIDPNSFHPLQSASGRSVNQTTGISVVTGTGGLVAPLALPVGATLREVTVAYTASTAGPVLGVWKKPLTGPYVILNDPPAGRLLPVGASAQLSTVMLDDTVDGTSTYMVLVNLVSSTNGFLHGLQVGYLPPPQGSTGFVPITPVRAYDSRQAGYAVKGPLAPNTDRVVSIKDAHDVVGGVIAADVVPAGAKAIACNLTATRTTGPNFLALTPGDATSYSASAINWIGPGVSIANGLIVATDVDRQVRVWNGNGAGSTDFIVDVTGYFLAL